MFIAKRLEKLKRSDRSAMCLHISLLRSEQEIANRAINILLPREQERLAQ